MTLGALKPYRESRPASALARLPRRGRVAAQAVMITASVLWVLPIGFALYVAVRPQQETNKYGYVALPHHLTLKNFTDAWTQSDMLVFFANSAKITVPAVILCLFLASSAALSYRVSTSK